MRKLGTVQRLVRDTLADGGFVRYESGTDAVLLRGGACTVRAYYMITLHSPHGYPIRSLSLKQFKSCARRGLLAVDERGARSILDRCSRTANKMVVDIGGPRAAA